LEESSHLLGGREALKIRKRHKECAGEGPVQVWEANHHKLVTRPDVKRMGLHHVPVHKTQGGEKGRERGAKGGREGGRRKGKAEREGGGERRRDGTSVECAWQSSPSHGQETNCTTFTLESFEAQEKIRVYLLGHPERLQRCFSSQQERYQRAHVRVHPDRCSRKVV